jgi:hypothetical protein
MKADNILNEKIGELNGLINDLKVSNHNLSYINVLNELLKVLNCISLHQILTLKEVNEAINLLREIRNEKGQNQMINTNANEIIHNEISEAN